MGSPIEHLPTEILQLIADKLDVADTASLQELSTTIQDATKGLHDNKKLLALLPTFKATAQHLKEKYDRKERNLNQLIEHAKAGRFHPDTDFIQQLEERARTIAQKILILEHALVNARKAQSIQDPHVDALWGDCSKLVDKLKKLFTKIGVDILELKKHQRHG